MNCVRPTPLAKNPDDPTDESGFVAAPHDASAPPLTNRPTATLSMLPRPPGGGSTTSEFTVMNPINRKVGSIDRSAIPISLSHRYSPPPPSLAPHPVLAVASQLRHVYLLYGMTRHTSTTPRDGAARRRRGRDGRLDRGTAAT